MLPATSQIQRASQRWIDHHSIGMKADKRNEIDRALLVLVLTSSTSDYLAEHDPQALKQAQLAVNGQSWETYL